MPTNWTSGNFSRKYFNAAAEAVLQATTIIFAFCSKQKISDPYREILNLFHRARTIRYMSLITEINDQLVRHLLANRAQDGESANAEVEDANR